MRGLVFGLAVMVVGCATSVQRLDGEVKTPAGPARTACERQSWLVIAPTRTEWAEEGQKLTKPRDDGMGLYRVGASFPESIPALSSELPASPMVERHAANVQRYNNQRLTAAILGAAGIAAIAVGTIVFINSFETTTTKNAAGSTQEEHNVVGGRAALGGVLIGVGFGLGIGGIVASPSQSQRARADSWRYAFLPPDDTPEAVTGLVTQHNKQVGEQCAAGKPAAAAAK